MSQIIFMYIINSIFDTWLNRSKINLNEQFLSLSKMLSIIYQDNDNLFMSMSMYKCDPGQLCCVSY